MSGRALRAALLVVALAAIPVVALVTRRDAPPKRAAPAFPSERLDGRLVTLADLDGRPVLVNFWASWCHPCRKEAPELARFASRGSGVRLVGVDTGDNAESARRFVVQYRWRFPVLRDGDGSVADAYGIAGLPTTFVVDRAGRIVRKLVGPQTAGSLDDALAAAG